MAQSDMQCVSLGLLSYVFAGSSQAFDSWFRAVLSNANFFSCT